MKLNKILFIVITLNLIIEFFVGVNYMQNEVIKTCRQNNFIELKGYKIYCSERLIDFMED